MMQWVSVAAILTYCSNLNITKAESLQLIVTRQSYPPLCKPSGLAARGMSEGQGRAGLLSIVKEGFLPCLNTHCGEDKQMGLERPAAQSITHVSV